MQQEKTREPVRLRSKKMKDGGSSLYLDIYHDGHRHYEFLKLYLVPEKTKSDRQKNRNTLAWAETVRAKRLLDIRNGDYGLKVAPSQDVHFFDYFISQMNRHHDATRELWQCVLVHLRSYEHRDILLSSINKEWCLGFHSHLARQPLSENTRFVYFSKLRACINAALRDELISHNPITSEMTFSKKAVERNYLTLSELRLLTSAPITPQNDDVRRAFLFSCLTGLRWSDVYKLTWEEVKAQDDFTRIVFTQKKTGGLEYMDLTPQAVSLMGKPSTGVVFHLPRLDSVNHALIRWVRAAGVTKHITFHCARHTFAILMLNLGTDIYTVSKLLGHTDVKTTQIYARVLDENKRAAVARIPSIL